MAIPEQQYDALAEQAIIASLFSEPEKLDELAETLEPNDFHEVSNSTVYDIALQLQQQGLKYDPVSVMGELKRQNLLTSVGGVGYFTEILSPNRLTQFGSDPLGYAATVKDLSLRRKLLEVATQLTEIAPVGSGLDATEVIQVAEENILSLASNDSTNKPEHAGDLWDETLALMDEAGSKPEGSTPGIPSGFSILDEWTGGWLPGQMIVVAARPSVGKTALAMDFARASALMSGKSTLFFSLEMSNHELMMRMLSSEARVELSSLKRGKLTQEERMNLLGVKELIQSNNLFFDASPKVNLSHVRSRAIRQKHSATGLDLIIIDYISLMEPPPGNKSATRENQVSALSRGLKLLAKEIEVPIIVLAQLNRSSESRVDKKPAIADLRESGAIEQDADAVFLINRPEQSDPNIRPGEADLIVAKNRNGPTGTIPLVPMLEFAKYVQGDGQIKADMKVYEDNAGEVDEAGQPMYAAPSEADEAPW